MELTPRSKFGLGSSLKKFVRKVIPNEISEIATKAAPFVAPFNPLLAAGMAGIGSFDQTGSLTKALTRGALTYGGGQAARYLGGAGFQQGIKPFAGADFSGGFLSGIQSLGTSPIGTETGLQLGQYQMFGGQPPQPISDTEFDLSTLEPSVVKSTGDVITQTTTPGYMDLTKKVLSGNLQEKTQALKQLGGKALKDIYTTDKGKVDKLAVAATIAGASSYLDAKRLAKEADLVADEDEYTKEMYEADKARYTEKYADILPASAFGLKEGGRVGYQEGGTDTVINADDLNLFQEGSPKYYDPEGEEISFQEFEESMKEPVMPRRKPEEMVERNKLEKLLKLRDNMEPEAFEMYLEKLKEESGDSGIPSIVLKKKMAIGGRVGFFEGTDDPQGRRKGIVSINPMEEDIEEGLTGSGVGSLVRKVSPYKYKGGVGGGKSPFTKEEISFLFKTLGKTGGPDRKYTMPQLSRILNSPGKFVDDEKALAAFLKVKGFKEGGRIGFMMGSEVPIRENQAGIREMDFRNTGGFVPPIGVKERADDIPAMLSNNEFVFTADAVKNAGGGDPNVGAQKMYTLMKRLESGGMV